MEAVAAYCAGKLPANGEDDVDACAICANGGTSIEALSWPSKDSSVVGFVLAFDMNVLDSASSVLTVSTECVDGAVELFDEDAVKVSDLWLLSGLRLASSSAPFPLECFALSLYGFLKVEREL